MAITQTHEPMQKKPLRLWPGVVIAILLALARFEVALFRAVAFVQLYRTPRSGH